MAFQAKNLIVGGLAAVVLSLSTGAYASVSATSDNGNNNGNQSSVHGVNIGVQQKTNVAANQGNGTNSNGGSGYGGSNVNIDQNVWVQIGNVVGGAVNITINFVNNIFS